MELAGTVPCYFIKANVRKVMGAIPAPHPHVQTHTHVRCDFPCWSFAPTFPRIANASVRFSKASLHISGTDDIKGGLWFLVFRTTSRRFGPGVGKRLAVCEGVQG